MTPRNALALILTLACAGPSLAQAEAPDRTEELLGSLAGCDESLLGSYHYALVLQGAKNIGHASFVVERAPEGSGAAYRIASTLVMKFGARDNQGTMVTLLDERFAVLAEREDKRETTRGVEVHKTSNLERAGDTWSYTAETVNDPAGEATTESLSFEHTQPGPVHSEMASVMLIARCLDRSAAGAYRFAALGWPGPGPDAAQEPTPHALVATLSPELVALDLGGERREAHVVRVAKDDEVMLFHVDDDGQLLALGPENAPIRFVQVADAEAARQDMGATEVALGRGATTPKDAVMLYFAVLAKREPVERLDEVTDWSAIQAEMGKADENVRDMSPKAVADLMKHEFDKRDAALTAEQLQLVESMVVVEEDGDTATANMQGMQGFRLARRGEGWFIVALPR